MKYLFILPLIFIVQSSNSYAIGPYINNGATVDDQATGLTWQQQTGDINHDGTITSGAYPDGDIAVWEDALAYCEDLILSGKSDWSLPNIIELRTIVDYSRYQPAIDSGFQCQAGIYCSSTTGHQNLASTSNRAGIDFEFGNRDISPGYVRCVRGGNASSTNRKINEIIYCSKEEGNEEIHSINSVGKNKKNLTDSSSSIDGTPSYSPDQKHIVFASNRIGNFDIYTMPAAGSSAPVNITNNSNDDGWPVWSPKGDKILFLSNRDDDKANHNVYTTDTDGKNVSRITFGYNVAHAVWSPDANQIAFASNGEIYIVKLSTGVVTQLTNNSWYDDYPSWSPDNKYIIYCSEQASGYPSKLDLFMMDISSKSTHVIMDSELDIRYPVWLPDGRLVFTIATEYGDALDQNSTREIYITKRKVQFDSTLTLSDLIRLTSNSVEDNHPMVAMPITGKQTVPDVIVPLLLRMK